MNYQCNKKKLVVLDTTPFNLTPSKCLFTISHDTPLYYLNSLHMSWTDFPPYLNRTKLMMKSTNI